jgi:hypothetical protein
MNASKISKASRDAWISSEAMVGIGITMAALGLLCLLLGTAEHFRSVPEVAVIWFGLGAALAVAGGIIAVSARVRSRR